MVTYTASALLHVSVYTHAFSATCVFEVKCFDFDPCVLQGLSFHLGAVLISLGFITYIEHGERQPNVLFSTVPFRKGA